MRSIIIRSRHNLKEIDFAARLAGGVSTADPERGARNPDGGGAAPEQCSGWKQAKDGLDRPLQPPKEWGEEANGHLRSAPWNSPRYMSIVIEILESGGILVRCEHEWRRMSEREGPEWFYDERFAKLQAAQEALAQRGFLFYPVEREHTEAQVTGPLLHRVHTQIKKRGFANLASRVAVSFSGYARDQRELFEIPEVRAYWHRLDRELPELPALLTILPAFRFNGPGQHVLLLGQIEQVRHRPDAGGYDVQVADGAQIVADALGRIRQAGRTYHLSEGAVRSISEQFRRGASWRL